MSDSALQLEHGETEPQAPLRPVVFLVGTRWFGVLGPCRKIIERLVDNGVDVYVFGQSDGHYQRYDDGLARLVEIRMRRSYVTPLSDALDILVIVRMARKLRPRVIHSFNPKPSLISFAAKIAANIPSYFIGVTGLGNTFIRAKLLRPLVTLGLRRAAASADFVFFQNDDDIDMFRRERIGDEKTFRKFIGPGVDLDEFSASETARDDRPIVVVCVGRLIWQKGIREFVEAGRLVKSIYGDSVVLRLIGEFDVDHPDCVDRDFIEAAKTDGVIEHIPWTDSVSVALAEAHINVLHSYREGAPRAILEASAMKLPTIGSDAIGVRELVVDGVTGYLVPLKDHEALAEAICGLVDSPELRQSMGEAAHEMIAIPLSLERATEAQLGMYRTTGVLS